MKDKKENQPMTAEQWLTISKELPFWIRRRALENAKKQYCAITHLRKSLKDVIIGCFIWKDTPEGFNFWNQVYLFMCNINTKLPSAGSFKRIKSHAEA